MSPASAAMIASAYLKDLISAGHLPSDKSYLACDPSKLVRARKRAMSEAREESSDKQTKVVGIGYDGRRDKHTLAMVPDKATGKSKMRMVVEEHESVTEEPCGHYLGHFTPKPPSGKEKPALKVAQGVVELLQKHDSTESLMVLAGDSTNSNTGWKGGTHKWVEELLGRRLFWAICNLHTNELNLRHLIAILDGPTSSKDGFTGPVGSLLPKVEQMPYNPEFEALPGGEDLPTLSETVVKEMSTDQKSCFKLVQALKAGHLPPEMQDMKCGPLCHARSVLIVYLSFYEFVQRWLTCAQRLGFMWTRVHGLKGEPLKILRTLVKFCITMYFKLFFDIKHRHLLVDAPHHILTSLRILKTQPKMVQDVITFYIRKNAWYAHPECLLLSLLSSLDPEDRQFAVGQILTVRAGQEYGDNSVRPRITPKLNLSATTLTTLISWNPKEVQEPSFTCGRSTAEIKSYLESPFVPPKFSCHTQSTERYSA